MTRIHYGRTDPCKAFSVGGSGHLPCIAGIGQDLPAGAIRVLGLAMLPPCALPSYAHARRIPLPERRTPTLRTVQQCPDLAALYMHPRWGVLDASWPDWCPPVRLRSGAYTTSRAVIALLATVASLPCRESAMGWFAQGLTVEDIQVVTGWDEVRTRDTIAHGLRALGYGYRRRKLTTDACEIVHRVALAWEAGVRAGRPAAGTPYPDLDRLMSRFHPTSAARLAHFAKDKRCLAVARWVALALTGEASIPARNRAESTIEVPPIHPRLVPAAQASLTWLAMYTSLGADLPQGQPGSGCYNPLYIRLVRKMLYTSESKRTRSPRSRA